MKVKTPDKVSYFTVLVNPILDVLQTSAPSSIYDILTKVVSLVCNLLLPSVLWVIF